MARKIFIVANEAAGGKKAKRLVLELKSFLEAADLSHEIHDTAETKSATTTVEKLDDSFTDLIIVGGDGTINEAINGLRHDIPVSIIPAGTGNDFIKNMNLGRGRAEYIETAIHGEIKRIDLGECNGRKFANGVGIGFDGQIVEDMFAKRVPILTGHAAYYYHVLRILGGYKEKEFNFKIDGKVKKQDLILLTIGNGTTFGGGFKLMPNAEIDDNLLEVCTIGKLAPLRRFLNISKLSNGTHGKMDMVDFYQAREIFVDENPLLFAHIDGERMGQPPFDIKVLPGALKIRVASA